MWLLLQAIRVQTAPGVIESALMHIASSDGMAEASRVSAMHARNPLHTFMFDSHGVLLNANHSAQEAFARHQKGQPAVTPGC